VTAVIARYEEWPLDDPHRFGLAAMTHAEATGEEQVPEEVTIKVKEPIKVDGTDVLDETPNVNTAPTAVTFRIDRVFGNHMILQRDRKIAIFGETDQEGEITVTFAGQRKTTNPVENKWNVYLGPLEASKEGKTMEVKQAGREQNIEIADIVVGDVWLISGQSNAGLALSRTAEPEEMNRITNNSLVRVFNTAKTLNNPWGSLGKWETITPASAGRTSALGYYFVTNLQQHLDIPVGLINSTLGGTRIEAWMNSELFDGLPEFRVIQESYHAQKGYSWGDADYISLDKDVPSVLFESMLKPFYSYEIKGLVWYQGEGGSARYGGQFDLYEKLLKAMLADWSNAWKDDSLRSYIIQLPKYKEDYQYIREAQWKAAKESDHSQIVVTIDTGDYEDIHPTDKKIVAQKLELAVRARSYDENIVYSGPMYTSMEIIRNEIHLEFELFGSALKALDLSLPEFTVCGSDYICRPAIARIEGDKVIVTNDEIHNPAAVQYAWSPYPRISLGNEEGLPAGPFRTNES
jgi:sialate O-acetylesterase